MLCCFRSREPARAPACVLPGCDAVRLLGEGSFGTVVLVRERSTSTLLAVKVMNRAQLAQEGVMGSVVRERRVLREAGGHPFVVECHSGFQTREAVVLVLEYVPGGDMYDLMKKYGCLDEAQVRFYLAEIVLGVEELHAHDFVFRDLKLENILIDAEGHARLTDFGLAGEFSSPRWDDRSVLDISGTAIYQAPEMLSQKGHGRCVDWWALGVLTYVLLTGRPPFSATTSQADLYHRIKNDVLDLDTDERLSAVSPACRDFIGRLLDKQPATRLGSDGDDAATVRNHPFFANMDWDALYSMELDAPLKPPLEVNLPPTPQHSKLALGKLRDKLRGKYKPLSRAPRSRHEQLDEGEYRRVDLAESAGGRISIGLDFTAQNDEASTRTWTGTNDDFGRQVPR